MPEAAKSHILGRVEWIDNDRRCGQIRPLVLVKKRQDGEWIVDREVEDEELGDTGRVFWPKIPNHQLVLSGQYVRFKVEPNLYAEDGKDQFVVAGDERNPSGRPVEEIGWPVLAADHVNGTERVVSPRAGHFSIGTTVYRRRLHDNLIDGPWQIAPRPGSVSAYLQPGQDGYVLEHPISKLPRETYHDWLDLSEFGTVLLVAPAAEMGRTRDLLTATDLASWLVRFLKRDKGLLSSLDKASPGWRDRLSSLVEVTTDPIRRRLEQDRLARLTPALDALAASEARLNELIETPRFKVVLDKAIADEVQTRRDQVEAAATGETRAFVELQRRIREQEQDRTSREKKALLAELTEIRAQIDAAERQHAEARAEVERDETAVRAAADHLVESRERITRDFFAFQGLLEANKTTRKSVANGNGSTNGHALVIGDGDANGPGPAVTLLPLVESLLPQTAQPVAIGPAIVEPESFLRGRLAPLLAAWGAQANLLQARQLNAALLACRWVACQCPSWGVAYVEAISGHARHRVVSASATWVTFDDAWRGEVEAFWRDAIAQPDLLHLLIIADADRALVQCWARPLLDLAAGLRTSLPSGEGWPTNLRLMACPAPDDAAWTVPDWVISHWAGVEPTTASGNQGVPVEPGHVPFAAWASWKGEPDAAPRLSAGLGAAARVAAQERSALARTLERLKPGTDPEDADRDASHLREGDARLVFPARGER